jgi:hypothetical protein
MIACDETKHPPSYSSELETMDADESLFDKLSSPSESVTAENPKDDDDDDDDGVGEFDVSFSSSSDDKSTDLISL